jgi:polyribonucleotide nucleotidyltransferase
VRKLAGGKRVENVDDVLSVGQKILVKITKIDDRGKLSLEPVLDDAPAAEAAPAEDAAAE